MPLSAERREVMIYATPAVAHRLVAGFESEGFSVEWEPPMEYRGGPGDAVQAIGFSVVGNFATMAMVVAYRAVVHKFREKFPACEIDAEDDEVERF